MTEKPDKKEQRERQQTVTRQIAESLQETDKAAIHTINRMVYVLGEERTLSLLEEARKVEENGGLMTDDGQQRRTFGGIFFKLAKNRVTSKERWRIFLSGRPAKAKEKPKTEPPTWEELKPIIDELPAARKGIATKMKLTLIGKPGKIIEKGSVVITSLQASKIPALPKGLPKPPEEPATWLVFIAQKQWNKVRDSIAGNPNDKLIVEGYPTFDPRLGKNGTPTLYAQMVTTTALQRARREAQQR